MLLSSKDNFLNDLITFIITPGGPGSKLVRIRGQKFVYAKADHKSCNVDGDMHVQDGIPKQNCRRHADQDGKEQDQDETETVLPASLFGFVFERSFANILYNRVRNDENDQSCGNRPRGDRNVDQAAAVLYAVKKSRDHPERHQNRKAKEQNVGMESDRL